MRHSPKVSATKDSILLGYRLVAVTIKLLVCGSSVGVPEVLLCFYSLSFECDICVEHYMLVTTADIVLTLCTVFSKQCGVLMRVM